MKQKDLLLLIVSFFILVVAYLGFSVYHNSVTSTIPEVLNIQITPISPSFDQKTIDNIKKRRVITPLYEINTAPTPVATQSGRTQ